MHRKNVTNVTLLKKHAYGSFVNSRGLYAYRRILRSYGSCCLYFSEEDSDQGRVFVGEPMCPMVADCIFYGSDMAGTVTFNRARGTHLLEPMENIVKKLLDEGLSVDEISKKIGMSKEEIFRLSKIDRETFLKLVTSRSSQTFSKAQVLRRG